MMESLLPEWEVAGYQRERTGAILPNVSPEQRLPHRRRRDGAHRRQPGHGVRAARRRDGPARSWPTDERYATHGARGAHAGGARRRSSRSGPRPSTADDLLRPPARGRRPRRAGSSGPRTCSPTRTSPPGRRSSGSPTPTSASCRCRTSSRGCPATPGPGPHRRARPRRAQRRGLPRPARPDRRRPTDSEPTSSIDLHRSAPTPSTPEDSNGVPARRRRRRHLHRRPARRHRQRPDLAGQDRLHPGGPVRRGAARHRAGLRGRRDRASPTSTEVLHGTTVATNAILEGKGATVGLVTTAGVPAGAADRPLLRARRARRLDHLAQAGAAGRAGEHRRGRSSGSPATARVVTALDDDDVRAKIAPLKEQGIEALAVSLINAFANGDHEKPIGAIAAEELPDFPISLSSLVLPELREYERTVTTVANGYVQPQVARYVGNLASQLADKGVDGQLYILRSDGGLASRRRSRPNPVNLLLSGPGRWCHRCGRGRPSRPATATSSPSTWAAPRPTSPWCRTSPRASAVRPRSATSTSAAASRRRAHGRRRRRLDRPRPAAHPGAAGRARSRPGAVPGPAGVRHRAATAPTVTDANVVLGYLPTALAGGEITLDVEARPRRGADDRRRHCGLDSVEAAAAGIIDIVNENMFGALRLVSVQQGFDPRDFALVAFGGAGPLHANALGRLTGAWPVIIPPSARACSAPTATPPRACATSRPGPAPPVRRAHRRRAARRSWTSWPPRRRPRCAREGVAEDEHDGRLHRRPALPRPGLRDPGHRRHRRLRRRPAAGWPRCGRRSTPSTSGCSPSCCAPTTRSSRCGPRPPGRARTSPPTRCPRATATRLRPRSPTTTSGSSGGGSSAGIYDRRRAPGRRRGHRTRRHHRDGLHHPGPARARRDRPPERSACSSAPHDREPEG